MTQLANMKCSEVVEALSGFPHKRFQDGRTSDIYASSDAVLDQAISAESLSFLPDGEWVINIAISRASNPSGFNSDSGEYFGDVELYTKVPGSFQEQLDVCKQEFGLSTDAYGEDIDLGNSTEIYCSYPGGEEQSVFVGRRFSDAGDVLKVEYYSPNWGPE